MLMALTTAAVAAAVTVAAFTPFDAACGDGAADGCACARENASHYERASLLKCCCHGVRSLGNVSRRVQVLIVRNAQLRRLTAADLEEFTELKILDISHAPYLHRVDADAFATLTNLQKLSIHHCPSLGEINGTLLKWTRNSTFQILALTNNRRLSVMPKIRQPRQTDRFRDLSRNAIASVGEEDIVGTPVLTLDLSHNAIRTVNANAFRQSAVDLLKLNDNPLTEIDDSAFAHMVALNRLDLSNTRISRLPTEGLKNVHSLTVKATRSLKQLPSIFTFKSLKEAHLTYPYHCCLFKHADKLLPPKADEDRTNIKEIREKYCNKGSARTERQAGGAWGAAPPPTNKSVGRAGGDGEWMDAPVELADEPHVGAAVCAPDDERVFEYFRAVGCAPVPDALNPCEDVMGFVALRLLIWLVWLSAILGNLLVMVVLSLVRHPRMRVHYFLMMNLALADLLIGIYLAMLAIEDARTAGEYYNYAVEWQTGGGCRVAGFVAVFASELSIVAMYLISFEIWYNTKYARASTPRQSSRVAFRYIFYGKRLKLRTAALLMALGWLFSLTMAALPLLGVSSYAVTSTCLPLAIDGAVDLVYVMGGLLVNVLAFCGITANYASIYCSVNGSASPSTRSEDMQVARKMAFLIGTDFICWAPTIVFGVTAASDLPLISISAAKVFLVLFFPINSFANPFLYVFFTRVIRADLNRFLDNHKWLQRLLPFTSRASKSATGFSHYYASMPHSGGREGRRNAAVQVTQSTSASSTRNSSVISAAGRGSAVSIDAPADEQDKTGRLMHLLRRKSVPPKPRFQPQMSDISEHSHSGHSHMDDGERGRSPQAPPLPPPPVALDTVAEEDEEQRRSRRHSSGWSAGERGRGLSESSSLLASSSDVSDGGRPRVGRGRQPMARGSIESGYDTSHAASPDAAISFELPVLVHGGSKSALELDDVHADAHWVDARSSWV